MMGCIQAIESRFPHCACCYCRNAVQETMQTTAQINEAQVDLSHFSTAKEILGIGGFGIVRRIVKVTCADANMNYAMKSMAKATVLSRPNGTSAVLTELKALIAVRDCEFICKIHYAFQDPSFLYLVLEYAAGADMRYNLRKSSTHRYSESLARLFIRQVIFALQYCHQCFILHRDIKPENILLFSNGRVKLTDFGVAKILPDIEHCRSTSGTHGYMAPEIYAAEHVHGTAFDWFCVGITLHEFLTGRRPFEAFRLQRYLTSNHPTDCLALDYLAQMLPSVSPACLEFVQQILHPIAHHRLGAYDKVQTILKHPWMLAEPPTLSLHALEFVQQELPSFRELVHQQAKLFKGSRSGSGSGSAAGGGGGSSRVNLSKEEATAILRQHQQAYVISPEIQTAFQEFDFNTKIVPSLRSHSRCKSRRLSSFTPRSSTHSQSTGHGGKAGISAVGSMSTSRDSSLEPDANNHCCERGQDLDSEDDEEEGLEAEEDDEYEVRSPRRSIIMMGKGGGSASCWGQGLVAMRRAGLCSPPVSSPSPSSVVMDPADSSLTSSPSGGSQSGSVSGMPGRSKVDGGGVNNMQHQKVTAAVEMKYL